MSFRDDRETRRRGDREKTPAASPSGSFSPRLPVSVSPRLLLVLITGIVLLYGVIYPNLQVILGSLDRDGKWSLANYRETISKRSLRSCFQQRGSLDIDRNLLRAGGNSSRFSF